MPIVLPIEFSCDSCGLTIRLPHVPGIVKLPVQATRSLAAMPAGWTLLDDGRVGCPDHQPRLVEPVAAIPDILPPLGVINGGRR